MDEIQRRLGYTVQFYTKSSLRCSFNELFHRAGNSFNWLSVAIDDVDMIVPKMKALEVGLSKVRKRFLELEFVNTDIKTLRELMNHICMLKPDRIVISFKPGYNTVDLKQLLDDFMMLGIWVETKGIPYCKTYVEHVWENFSVLNTSFEKDRQCDGCLFIDSCKAIDTSGEQSLAPILRQSEDFKRFMNEDYAY